MTFLFSFSPMPAYLSSNLPSKSSCALLFGVTSVQGTPGSSGSSRSSGSFWARIEKRLCCSIGACAAIAAASFEAVFAAVLATFIAVNLEPMGRGGHPLVFVIVVLSGPSSAVGVVV